MDYTNNYSVAFYLSGVCLIVSAAFVVLVDRLVHKRREAAEPQVYCAIGQQEDWETAKAESDTVT